MTEQTGLIIIDDTPIHRAIANVMADVGAVSKDSRNQSQGFNFRGIDAVVNAVGPVLRQHKVVVLPELVDLHLGTVEVGNGDRRRPIGHVVVQVRYRFIGPRGDELAALVPGEAMDSGDKALPKAMSVAYRVALLQALCIPTDEPDPDAQVYERAAAVTLASPETRASIAQAIRSIPTARKVAAQEAWGEAGLPTPQSLTPDQVPLAWSVINRAADPEQPALEMETA